MCGVLLAAIVFTPGVSPLQVSPTSDEYAVYVNLLAERFRGPRHHFVRDQSRDGGRCQPITGEFNGARLRERWNSDRIPRVVPGPDVVESFARVRNSPARVEARRLSIPSQRIVSRAEIASAFGPHDRGLVGAWADFRTRYGGGYLVFSRVGFSHNRAQAFLSYSYYCGGLCAGGVYVLMHKVRGSWRIVSEQPTWAS